MKKVLIIVTLLVLIISIGIISLPKIWALHFIKSRFSETETPWAYILPMDRTVKSSKVNLTDYLSFTCDNLKFNVPWKDLRQKKEREAFILLSFHSVKNKGIYMNRGTVTEYKISEGLLGEDPSNAEKLKELMGDQTFKSNYSVFGESLGTTPDQASIFRSSKDLGKAIIMLMLKRILTEPNIEKIYKFETKVIRGFQFGDPQKDNPVAIKIFNNDGRIYRMSIHSANQDEIDFILSSMIIL